MTGRPVVERIVIANYITVTTDWKTSLYPLRQRPIYVVVLSQEVHNAVPMLPSEDTLLMTARILWGSVTAQLQSQPGNQNSMVPACSLAKEKKDIDLWSLSGGNPPYCFE